MRLRTGRDDVKVVLTVMLKQRLGGVVAALVLFDSTWLVTDVSSICDHKSGAMATVKSTFPIFRARFREM